MAARKSWVGSDGDDIKMNMNTNADVDLFKDPPAKEDCPICFLPMPYQLISCMTLPPATLMSVPIYDFAMANDALAHTSTEQFYSCCGKSICRGCIYSFSQSGNDDKCPFCKAERLNKTDEEEVEEIMKRVEVNDAGAISALADCYYHGLIGLQQDRAKALQLWKRAADLGYSHAHYNLANKGGDLKKAQFHYEAAAMAGNEAARFNLANMEYKSGNVGRAVKHWIIAASGGHCRAMHNSIVHFNQGLVSRESIDSTLIAYNTSCAEMRSEARDAWIKMELEDDE
jgi:TPR repeat protein